MNADTTPRIVKKAEAIFRLRPPEVEAFDHFKPARWLLEHPEVLREDSPGVQATLDRAERVFKTYNPLLSQG